MVDLVSLAVIENLLIHAHSGGPFYFTNWIQLVDVPKHPEVPHVSRDIHSQQGRASMWKDRYQHGRASTRMGTYILKIVKLDKDDKGTCGATSAQQ